MQNGHFSAFCTQPLPQQPTPLHLRTVNPGLLASPPLRCRAGLPFFSPAATSPARRLPSRRCGAKRSRLPKQTGCAHEKRKRKGKKNVHHVLTRPRRIKFSQINQMIVVTVHSLNLELTESSGSSGSLKRPTQYLKKNKKLLFVVNKPKTKQINASLLKQLLFRHR